MYLLRLRELPYIPFSYMSCTFLGILDAQEGLLYDRLTTKLALARAPLYVIATDKADVMFDLADRGLK